MIECTFILSEDAPRLESPEEQSPAIIGVQARGHADFAALGKDVVCAAASVLLQTLWLGLREIAQIEVTGGWQSGNLQLAWTLAAARRPDVAALTATTQCALAALATQYPRNVRVRSQVSPRAN